MLFCVAINLQEDGVHEVDRAARAASQVDNVVKAVRSIGLLQNRKLTQCVLLSTGSSPAHFQ